MRAGVAQSPRQTSIPEQTVIAASLARLSAASISRPPLVPLAGLVVLCLIWGLSVPLMKLGVQLFDPLQLAALRYASAAPFFMLLLIGRKLPSRTDLLRMAGLGMLGIDCGQVTQVLGVQRTSAAVATIMFATIPIFVVIFAAWRLRQPLRIHHAIGLVLALGGIALVATQRLGGAGAQSVTAAGVVLIMISAVSIALYYVLSAELSRHYPVTTVAAWSSLIGVVPLLPMTARGGVAAAGLTGAAIVLYLGLLVTVAGMWIWLSLLRALPARIAAGSQYLQPLIGVAASAWLFSDAIGPAFGAGTVLVFIGIALTSAR